MNTTTGSYDPDTHAAALGVQVHTARLPHGVFGCWDPTARIIWLDTRLSEAQRRSTLTHELIHAQRGGPVCSTGVLQRREESAVETAAAALLITLEDLADAVAWSPHPAEQAELLAVDLDLLEARHASLTDRERAYINRRQRAADGGAA